MKFPVVLLVAAWSASASARTADEAWSDIERLRQGPAAPSSDAPGQVVATFRGHWAQQEKSLEGFLAGYPSDPRRYEAIIELAGVRTDIGVSLSDRNRVEKAIRSLLDLERDKSVPSKIRADAAYRRITITMQTVNLAAAGRPEETSNSRNLIRDAASNFAARYPDDRRAARLLVEAATLFDDMPDRKRAVLEQAGKLARDEGTRQRIADDLKRLDLLGKPGQVSFDTVQGGNFSLEEQRGKVVVLVFWAGWSPPSVAALAGLAKEAKDWPNDRVVVATVSLDEKKDNCTQTLRILDITDWPTSCSGKVWQDPVARSLAINALATVFVYDTEGKLRSLNARENCGALVRGLLLSRP